MHCMLLNMQARWQGAPARIEQGHPEWTQASILCVSLYTLQPLKASKICLSC